MARHDSTRDFLRQMPNALLARYFREQGLFGDLDFTAMKEGSPDALFAAWLKRPDTERNTMEVEFREVFDLCCDKGFLAIHDEARWPLRDTPEALVQLVDRECCLSGLGARGCHPVHNRHTFERLKSRHDAFVRAAVAGMARRLRMVETGLVWMIDDLDTGDGSVSQNGHRSEREPNYRNRRPRSSILGGGGKSGGNLRPSTIK